MPSLIQIFNVEKTVRTNNNNNLVTENVNNNNSFVKWLSPFSHKTETLHKQHLQQKIIIVFNAETTGNESSGVS